MSRPARIPPALVLCLLAHGSHGCTTPPRDRLAAAAPGTGPAALAGASGADLIETLTRTQEAALEAAACDTRGGAIQYGRAARDLAETWKFRASVARDGQERNQAVAARLAVVEEALAALAPWYEREPGQPDLAFAFGELLAFRITGTLSGLEHGNRSRRILEDAVKNGAGPAAELALAKRFYYLPAYAGGSTERAEAEIRAILERHPDFARGFDFLGQVLLGQGGAGAAAQAAFARALELDPASMRARFFQAHPERKAVP